MSGTVEVPKVGPVKKPVLFGIVGAGAAVVGWRYYKARQAAAADTTAAATDGTFGDPGTIPAVAGAYTGQDVGLPDTTPPASSDYGFTGTTNSMWSQYVATQLSNSGQYGYATVLTDCGLYLLGRPLTTAQQQVIQAAIAVAGYPPEGGSHPILPGGDAPITVAPAGLAASSVTSTTATLTWHAVSGATHYRIYRKDTGKETVGESNDATWQARGLEPGHSYQFQVAAVPASGKSGPMSGFVTVKTGTKAPATPGKPIISSLSKTSLTVNWHAAAGATGYHVYRNGTLIGTTVGTWLHQTGLKPGTSYSYQVQATSTGGGTSAKSASASARTKK